MLQVEHFRDLIEIMSLKKALLALQDKVDQQNQRLDFLKSQKENRNQKILEYQNSIEELKKQNVELEKDLFEQEKKLSKAKEQYQNITTQNEEEKLSQVISELTDQVDALTEKGLQFLEEIETYQVETQEAQNFLKGLDETFNEINSEIEKEVAPFLKEISGKQERIQALKDQLPSSMKILFQNTEKKHPKNPIAYIRDNGCCDQCRYHLDQTTKNEVESLKSLNTCSGCNRILIPLNSKM